jgi:hypothetical protein
VQTILERLLEAAGVPDLVDGLRQFRDDRFVRLSRADPRVLNVID